MALAAAPTAAPMHEQHRIDTDGNERWFTLVLQNLAGAGEPHAGWRCWDTTAEQQARVAATAVRRTSCCAGSSWRRNGMLIYDDTALIVRSNTAFEALVDRVPMLATHRPMLQACWLARRRHPRPELVPNARCRCPSASPSSVLLAGGGAGARPRMAGLATELAPAARDGSSRTAAPRRSATSRGARWAC